ncbi:uncharacterized protein LOC110008332 [Amborella trichopoda]|uniref:uncharacterized protein LOC110008332 n=1 Tax=Amborella trichopoda TaxID=13333 RepID=UPI0009BDA6DC|nr:uncharacterized protein LOC110008332 [Amborella trichopoda]XP_020530739.1 uncharacterized protein LOC110008332 [Amborella trichopoda]|eukprot:XP_020530737.1 uncharacterized protein LOC110008332 [Amborella trichopoda]
MVDISDFASSKLLGGLIHHKVSGVVNGPGLVHDREASCARDKGKHDVPLTEHDVLAMGADGSAHRLSKDVSVNASSNLHNSSGILITNAVRSSGIGFNGVLTSRNCRQRNSRTYGPMEENVNNAKAIIGKGKGKGSAADPISLTTMNCNNSYNLSNGKEEFPPLLAAPKNGEVKDWGPSNCWDLGKSKDLLFGHKGIQNGMCYFENLELTPTETINEKCYMKIEEELVESCLEEWDNCLFGFFWVADLNGGI